MPAVVKKVALPTGIRIGEIKFREHGKLLHGRKLLLEMKGRIY